MGHFTYEGYQNRYMKKSVAPLFSLSVIDFSFFVLQKNAIMFAALSFNYIAVLEKSVITKKKRHFWVLVPLISKIAPISIAIL